MDVESSICLSDLVPALRWSRPQQVAEALSDPRLPSAWWSSMPLQRAFAATGLDWVCERLALLASSRWDHLPLGDVLPTMALHPIDPTLPGYPEPARTAIVGLGGWHRLRRLTPSRPEGAGVHPRDGDGYGLPRGARQAGGPAGSRGRASRGHQAGPARRVRHRFLPRRGASDRRPRSRAPAPSPARTAAPPRASRCRSAPTSAATPEPSPPPPTSAGTPAPSPGWATTRGRAANPGVRRPPFRPRNSGPPGPSPATAERAPGSFPGDPPSGRRARPRTRAERSTGSFPAVGRDQRSTGSFPAVGRDQRSTGSFPAVGGGQSPLPQRPAAADSSGPHTGSLPSLPGGSASYGSQPAPVPSDTDHAMVRVVDSLFRGLNKLELAVAEHRLFAEDPVSLRTLAHKMLVEREILSQAQRTAEERVLTWLRSSESAPITGHMFRLTEWLGAAATEDQLIGADPAHPATVPSLRTPLWRVLVTLMPDRRLQDGWLVVGDIQGLQARTRRLLASAQPDADMVELMAELGIRAHSAKAWLDALPPEQVHDPVAASDGPPQPLPRRTPGANGHHHRGGQPIPAAAANSIDPSAALATLSALSNGRSPMLQGHLARHPGHSPPPPPSPSSDPRRWQRIEVKPEHLRGGPVPVPQNYAAQLGMRPGTLLSVTGPGDNAIVLVWQGQQPVFDSLQPVLMRLNARPGDQVYVTVDGYRLEAQLTG
ncbi:hypothetical protein ACFSTC_17145 [Nonomuraea ferruginea]